uniref:E3 ubiquitin-protein ligase TRIM39-like n=1 Tax=Sinocyclocheilus grahami TaxID=75366 RepID=A0A672T2H7_SINGR
MSSSSGPLTEELQCSICLDAFTDPVTAPCGHNFCKTCLNKYWDNSQTCNCPYCKETFNQRPDLKINTTLREVRSTEMEKAARVEFFTDLIRSIERCQTELLETVDEQQKTAGKQEEELIEELEQEISELTLKSTELEQLSHTEDHLHLLQGFSSLLNWPEISVETHESLETLRRALTQLQDTIDEKFTQTELKWMQQYAVDVTLDPDTAHPDLILSYDGKQVRCGDIKQKLPYSPKRFTYCPNVLAEEGFSSGKFYFEVQVKGKTEWELGVARESIKRKGKITLSPEDGFWTLWLRNKNQYAALSSPSVPLALRVRLQRIGVFVDYEKGLVSFYDVESSSHIYSFTGQSFTGKLYPAFGPSLSFNGRNSAPLIITPVNSNQ